MSPDYHAEQQIQNVLELGYYCPATLYSNLYAIPDLLH
jgi:hypothetical protein